MAELLVSHGADINQRWVRGMTPLMEVADWGTRGPRIVAGIFSQYCHTRTPEFLDLPAERFET